MAENKKNNSKINALKRWAPLAVIAALMAGAYATGVHEYVSLEAFHAQKGALLDAVAARPVLSALAFLGIYTVSVALSLPIATLLTLSGGFLFGKWLGTLFVVAAATIGASIIFLIAKTSLGETLREKAGGLYERVEGNMKDNAVGYLLFMRLVPLFPFVLVNIVPALFNVSLRVFVLTTFIGILPGSFVFVNVGEQLGEIESLSDLVSGETLLAFGLLGLFALIPTLYKQFKARKGAAAVIAALMVFSAGGAQAGVYNDLLQSHVREVSKNGVSYNGVDYDAWAKDARHATALAEIVNTDPASLGPRDEQMAFWINAYNLLTIDLIVREGERESIKNLGSTFTNVWKKFDWEIAGQKYTLDQIEHKILRPMGDARIHFAINCASVSCPDLRAEEYRASTLNQQLNEQTVKTLNNASKGFVEEEGSIRISKIFDWFEEDFKGGDVKAWLHDYKDFDDSKSISYLNYDWSLNNVK